MTKITTLKGIEMQAKANALHSSKSQEWGTPPDIIERYRRVMGGFDLDPSSSPAWNETVRATRILTKEDDALTKSWYASGEIIRVFCNPPGGLVSEFWERCALGIIEHEGMPSGIKELAWIGFSLEQLQQLQTFLFHPLSWRVWTCIPQKRVKYVGAGQQDEVNPTHASYLSYYGTNQEAFINEFRDLGRIIQSVDYADGF